MDLRRLRVSNEQEQRAPRVPLGSRDHASREQQTAALHRLLVARASISNEQRQRASDRINREASRRLGSGVFRSALLPEPRGWAHLAAVCGSPEIFDRVKGEILDQVAKHEAAAPAPVPVRDPVRQVLKDRAGPGRRVIAREFQRRPDGGRTLWQRWSDGSEESIRL